MPSQLYPSEQHTSDRKDDGTEALAVWPLSASAFPSTHQHSFLRAKMACQDDQAEILKEGKPLSKHDAQGDHRNIALNCHNSFAVRCHLQVMLQAKQTAEMLQKPPLQHLPPKPPACLRGLYCSNRNVKYSFFIFFSAPACM